LNHKLEVGNGGSLRSVTFHVFISTTEFDKLWRFSSSSLS